MSGDSEATPSSLAKTTDLLNQALQSNIGIQAKVARELQSLAGKKAENRRLATQTNQCLSQSWANLDDLATPQPSGLSDSCSSTCELLGVHGESKVQKRCFSRRRKWNRRFFVDTNGSIPEDNVDTTKRRKIEKEAFFHHESPPWSKKEVRELLSIADELTSDSELDIDQERLATLLSMRSNNMTLPRTPVECRLCYVNSRPPKPFTKQESILILERAHKHERIPWKDVCQSRSGWQSLLGYNTELSTPRLLGWSAEEDELLFKYVAAMGPQFLLDRAAASEISSRILKLRSPKQILTRASASLVNPSFVRDLWVDDEERRLALCMKLYREAPSPLVLSSTHFPHRASSSVSQKWHRSLSPEYSMRPFTKEEDRKLLEAVAACSDVRWVDLAPRFLSRHPQALSGRWREIASKDDLLKRYRLGLKLARSKGGVNDLLGPSDFVVRIRANDHGIEQDQE